MPVYKQSFKVAKEDESKLREMVQGISYMPIQTTVTHAPKGERQIKLYKDVNEVIWIYGQNGKTLRIEDVYKFGDGGDFDG